MQDNLIRSLDKEITAIQNAIVALENKANSLHQSAKRLGSTQGYTKPLHKARLLLKVALDLRNELNKSNDELLSLLDQNKDKENSKDQRYNYSKVDLHKLPIRRR